MNPRFVFKNSTGPSHISDADIAANVKVCAVDASTVGVWTEGRQFIGWVVAPKYPCEAKLLAKHPGCVLIEISQLHVSIVCDGEMN